MGDNGMHAGVGGDGLDVKKGDSVSERKAQRFKDGFLGRKAAGQPLGCSLIVAALLEFLRGEGCFQVRLHRRVEHARVLRHVNVDVMNDNEERRDGSSSLNLVPAGGLQDRSVETPARSSSPDKG